MSDAAALPAAAVPPLPPRARHLLARALAALDRGDVDAAGRSLDSVLALAPGSPHAMRGLGRLAGLRGDCTKAIDCYRQVLAVWPRDADSQLGLGAALFAAGEVAEGLAHLRHACELDPDSASAWLNLGEALQQSARGDAAVAALGRAVALAPASVAIRLSLAGACASAGDVVAATRAYHEVLHRDAANAHAWFGLAHLNTYRFGAAEAGNLRRYYAAATPASKAHELLGFALGKALEDQGDYAAAFDTFRSVNAGRHARSGWNAAAERAHAEAIRVAFSRWTPRPPVASDPGREVIFIASLPRSGSSLVEQILASHPEVEGANEIQDLPDLVDRESRRRHEPFPRWLPLATAGDWQRLGQAYLARTQRWRTRKPRSTDKNLANWYLAGAALAMLPTARVVIVRRDPLETCLACYRQYLGGDAGFTTDLDDMADYCIDFFRLTRFWLERFAGRVFEVSYERLVRAPEPVVRGLLAFCGLAFEPACLAFDRADRAVLSAPSAAQVRQPLRRDTARADRYGDRLDGLRRRLQAAGLPDTSSGRGAARARQPSESQSP